MIAKPKPFILLLTDAGMGDMVCYLVAVDYLIRTFTHVEFLVVVPDYMYKFAQHVLPSRANLTSFSETPKFPEHIKGFSTAWNEIHTPMRTHPVDYAFHVLADRHEYRLNNKNYLQIRPDEINVTRLKLPNKYVAITATASEACKALPPQIIDEVSDFVIEKGYTPVYIGKEESDCGYKDFKVKAKILDADYSKGLNLINKTSLLETAKVISQAYAYIGMDGGPTHLAGCTDTHIIAGYSLVDPIHVAPIRNGSQTYKFQAVEPGIEVPYRYHQTNTNFVSGDYRLFPYEEVIKSLNIGKWLMALQNVL